MITTGQRLIRQLQDYGVETVFGIPGVHTIELYRGLAEADIQHITPRHEQGAGFMADAYARITGKPGVCFVITGPGLSNMATAMGQALADSIPMLVISTVNPQGTQNLGCLHAMPNQQAMIKPLTIATFELNKDDCVDTTMAQVFAALSYENNQQLGPVHLQVSVDVIGQPAKDIPSALARQNKTPLTLSLNEVALQGLQKAAELINQSPQIVVLAGGGATKYQMPVQQLAKSLNAPVVTTINGRGLMCQQPLSVPASPSLGAVRALLSAADCVIALGTEMGETDFDMYQDNQFPKLKKLIRIDINPKQLCNEQQLGIHADIGLALKFLLPLLVPKRSSLSQGEARAKAARQQAFSEQPANYQKQHTFLQHIIGALPGAIIVGDSTQPVYAGNTYFEATGPCAWFNSATGFGTLGYAVPGAVGAALGQKYKGGHKPIVAITGDGGLQFCLAELATAQDVGLPVIFIVWNNQGFGEIESSMLAVGITPVGVSPKPPELQALAQAYALPYVYVDNIASFGMALEQYAQISSPIIIEVNAQPMMSSLSS
ncbi:MAG: 5-guanidino-2-oxopentanoate decarboxylase [Gammaproteobacteria bacterium]|nr:5-guanidino-2-oxopentanoate decarboxylase [Gammaproteobacteria bacterium]